MKLTFILATLCATHFVSAFMNTCPISVVHSRQRHHELCVRKEVSEVSSKMKAKNKKNYTNKGPRVKLKKENKRHDMSGPRPVLAKYEENTSPEIQTNRLREAINCEHFEECSGCSVNDKVTETDIVQSAKSYFSSPWIRQKMISRPHGSEEFYKLVVPSPLTAWRTQAKLVAAPKSSAWAKDGCTFGLYRQRSHQVVDIPNCLVHHPSINKAVHVLQQATAKAGTSAYDEESREGGLRYVQFQVNRPSQKVCLTLVWNADGLKDAQPALSRLVKELNRIDPDLWHSMWVNCNNGLGNSIIARNANRWHRLSGPEFLREPLPVGDRGWLHFTPLTFRQGNIDGFDILANAVAQRVPPCSKVCELYAGVGFLGLTALAYHAGSESGNDLQWLRCSDENPNNSRCFERALETLPPKWVGRKTGETKKREEEGMTIADLMQQMERGQVIETEDSSDAPPTYMVASAAKALKNGQALGADVMIVDPPRKGLEPEVLNELCKPVKHDQDYTEDKSMLTVPDEMACWTNDVRTLIYVSCGFPALASDAERLLTSNGGWMLESATGYILFPGSNHVETVAVFCRTG